jgi:hypothetical protein
VIPIGLLVLKEAIVSTALKHLSGCGCLVCRAARGDQEAFARVLVLKEATASTALKHPSGCGCLVCRAARGDQEAFARVLLEGALDEGGESQGGQPLTM